MFIYKTQLYRILIFVVFFFISISLFAQTRIEDSSYFIFADDDQNPSDTLSIDISALNLYPDIKLEPLLQYKDTLILRHYYLPLVLDEDFFKVTTLGPDISYLTEPQSPYPKVVISQNKLFADNYDRKEIYRGSYDYILRTNVLLIKYMKKDFPKEREVLTEMQSSGIQNLFRIDYDFEKVDQPDRFKQKRKYWLVHGNNLVQFSQNYISENWYKGGVGNLNLQSIQNLTINYKKDKIQFDNSIEWKLSLYTNPSDTLRSIKIGEDLVRTYSNFGLQAANHWFYSSNLEIKTQFFENFKENSTSLISSILSPLYANLGLGMRYQTTKTYPKVKGKKLDFNTDISPLSAQFTYVMNEDVDPARFGIKDDKKYLLDLGSTINANFSMFFNKNVSFTSRFKYFTNYHKVTVESENRLNMPINRYFSTSLYLYARFDDTKGMLKDSRFGLLQVNELLSFGFNYKW